MSATSRWRSAFGRSSKRRPFWEYVDRSGGLDACWPWMGSRNEIGYGIYREQDSRRPQRAHRIVWRMATGEEPPVVMHVCDNPPCCNPLHLAGGTQTENLADMTAKGRRAPNPRFRGEEHPRAKLSVAVVQEARRRYRRGEQIRTLAEEQGVAPQVMRNAVLGRTWKDVA